MSPQISMIKEILDDLKKVHTDFWSTQMANPEIKRETHSFVCEKEDVIIGRDDDKRIVLNMLLDTSVQEAVSVISIVRIGRSGKTTLAQLVYNHQEIIEAQFHLRMWVRVSEDFNVKYVLGRILAAATDQATDSSSLSLAMDLLRNKLQEKLKGQKFILVLDDIWDEDPRKWQDLRKMLTQGCKSGSRIIVTTRSKTVASIVGSHQHTTHELKGLSDEDSWNLFERMTVEPGQEQLEERFIEIGKQIVPKCANVPLAIRVAGSLVKGYSEDIWWEHLKNIDLLATMKHGENSILNVLKLSYHHLPTHLKCCFTYCAVYPKDYEINKEQLIQLWMAQGYILPSDEQSFEVLGEEYFKYLLQRCFFQDVKKDDEEDEIISFKMHDLIHDLAKEVAGPSIKSEPHDHQNSLVKDALPKSTRFA